MSHNAWLALHVLGVVIFLGNIIVTAVWKVLADRTRNPAIVAYAQRLVTITDIAFTATGVILIIVSGQVLADDFGGVFSGPFWLTLGWSLFIASGVIWVGILIPIQVKQARLAKHFGNEGVIYSIPHNTLALAGEVGEFANIVKKIERGDLDIRDADVRMRLMMEWTDIFIYHMLIGGLIKVNPMMAYNYVRAENEKRFGQHD